MPLPDLSLRLARNATLWATLTPAEQRQRIWLATWHLQAHAEARRHITAHPPRPIPVNATGFGSLLSIPGPVPGTIFT